MTFRSSTARASLRAGALLSQLLLILLLCGCSYHGVLRSPALSDAAPPSSTRGAEIVLSDTLDGVSNVDFTVYAVTFYYDIKEAYFNAAKATLESAYGRIETGVEMPPGGALFAVPYFKARTISTTSTSATLETLSRIDVYEGPGGNLIRSYQSIQQVNWVEPPSAMALGFFTGLTLFAAAPVTLPIALSIEGNHGRDLLEKAIRDSFELMGTELAQDRKRDADVARIDACFQAIGGDPPLAGITGKVALVDVNNQTLEMLANASTPTEQEKAAISTWDAMIAACYAEQDDFMKRWGVPGPSLWRGDHIGEYAKKRKDVADAFVSAQTKIADELAEKSAEAQARANSLAMEAQRNNLAEIQTRQMQAQTVLMGVQTLNQAISINQQNQQHRELINQLNRPRMTNCQANRYSVNCTSW